MFITSHFNKEVISSANDLFCISSIVSSYSFTQKQDGIKAYYIWMEGYDCTFQISADYVYSFDDYSFRQFAAGNSFTDLYIARSKIDLLSTNEKLLLYHINDQERTYLSMKSTLKIHNRNTQLYAGIFFLILGASYYFIRRLIWKPN